MHLPAGVYPVSWSGAHKMCSACHEEMVQEIHSACSADNRTCYNGCQTLNLTTTKKINLEYIKHHI